jgi:hypothetical protein
VAVAVAASRRAAAAGPHVKATARAGLELGRRQRRTVSVIRRTVVRPPESAATVIV